MTEMEKELTGLLKEQSAQNKQLLAQIEVLKEQVAYLTQKLFGPSSEKRKVNEGQISLFDENHPFFKNQR